jgi:trk system potassium uptake protein TrkA
MRVVIVGCGRVGAQLANDLSSQRHAVVVIDASPLSFGRLSREFSGRMLTGIGFDRDVLQQAEIESADALAATTDKDNVNIVVAVTAKEVFRVPRVVARIYDPEAAELYRREGIPTVTPTLQAATAMKAMIANAGINTLATLGSGEVELVQVEVGRPLAGRSLQELTIPGESVVTAIVRRGQAMVPRPESRVEAGDVLHFSVMARTLPNLEKLFAHA